MGRCMSVADLVLAAVSMVWDGPWAPMHGAMQWSRMHRPRFAQAPGTHHLQEIAGEDAT